MSGPRRWLEKLLTPQIGPYVERKLEAQRPATVHDDVVTLVVETGVVLPEQRALLQRIVNDDGALASLSDAVLTRRTQTVLIAALALNPVLAGLAVLSRWLPQVIAVAALVLLAPAALVLWLVRRALRGEQRRRALAAVLARTGNATLHETGGDPMRHGVK